MGSSVTRYDIAEAAREIGLPPEIYTHPGVIDLVRRAAAAERNACLADVKQARCWQIVVYPPGYHVDANSINSMYEFQHRRCVDAVEARNKS